MELNSAFEKYRLNLFHNSHAGWVSTLLPLDFELAGGAHKPIDQNWFLDKILRISPCPIKKQFLLKGALQSLEITTTYMKLIKDIGEGRVDGFYLSDAGKNPRDCLDALAKNYQENKRIESLVRAGSGGCMMWGSAIPDKEDAMAQYLQHGRLEAKKSDGRITLTMDHETLRPFHSTDYDFEVAYNYLSRIIKKSISPRKFRKINL